MEHDCMTELAHILVVDDDPSIRRVMQFLLSDAGYRVSLATTGEEALAFLELITPDLILLDLMLPGLNGQEVTAQIKADPSKPFIPIILVTGQNDQRSKISSLDAGADDFLSKPVEFPELLARVRGMLRLQRSQRSFQGEQRKTELLLSLIRELGTTLDLDQLLRRFLDRLVEVIGAVRASIILIHHDTPYLYSSMLLDPSPNMPDILQDGVAGWILEHREPVLIEDTRLDDRWVATFPHQRLVRSVAAMPIMRERQILGVLTLVHHTPNYFTTDHLELLESVAAQSAITFENAELFRLTTMQKDMLERRTEELQQINRLSHHLTELMRPEQLLHLVTHLVQQTFNFPIVTVMLRDGHELVVSALAGDVRPDMHLGLRYPINTGVVGWVVTNQMPLNVPDVEQDPRAIQLHVAAGVRSELAVPIYTARRLFGVLHVQSQQVGAFGPDDATLLGTLAGQIGVALENANLFDIEQRRVRQLAQINTLSVALTAQLDSVEDLRITTDAIANIFGIEQCGIVVSEPGRRHARVACRAPKPQRPNQPLRFNLPVQQLATVLDITTPEIISSVAEDTRLALLHGALERANISSLVVAPLMSAGKQIGLMALDITNARYRFDATELTLLETIASLITQVFDNARLYRRVEDERSTLNAVLTSAADPILLIGTHNELLLANRAAKQRFDFESGDELRLEDVIHDPDLLNLLSRPTEESSSHELRLPDGTTFSISIAPVDGADKESLGRVAVLQDITAIKELERNKQERLRDALRRYVSPAIVEQMLEGGGEFGVPSERTVVVLFADLRGYTALTEGIDAKVLVDQVLNRYFNAMTNVLYHYEGTIDKFLGDGVLGVFGTPIAREDDLQRSLMAAVDMQRAFQVLQQQWEKTLGLRIGMGIGMAYGNAVVGNIGSEQRLDYTLVGDVVNTASRLGGLAEPNQILVSYHLIDKLPLDWNAPWPIRMIDKVTLKGKQQPHLIYTIDYPAEAGSESKTSDSVDWLS
jgi:adenylate cyclase